MTSSIHETEILADPTVPMIRIVREFSAPPARVFRAHTDPDLFVQWNGPRERQMRIDHFDCRTGGSYRYLMGSSRKNPNLRSSLIIALQGTWVPDRP